MPTAAVTHDITISDTNGSNKHGFMLSRSRTGQRLFRIQDSQTLAPRRLSMGELTEAELPADIQLIWTQDDWRVGVGGINHRDHPKKLASAIKIDASSPNKLQLAREVKATTLASGQPTPDDHTAAGFATVGNAVWAFVGRDAYRWDFTPIQREWFDNEEPAGAVTTVFKNGVEFKGDAADTNTIVPAWDTDTQPDRYLYLDAGTETGPWNRIGASAGKDGFLFFARGLNAAGQEALYGGYDSTASAAGKHHVRITRDPTTVASWGDAIEVGDSATAITALVSSNDEVLVCKEDGVYILHRDGESENITPEMRSHVHPDNFRNAFNWNGRVLLPLGQGGMLMLTGRELRDVSMERYAPEQTQWHGSVLAVAGDPTRVFIMVDELSNTQVHLFMAEWAEFLSELDFRWHHIGTVSYTSGLLTARAALFVEGEDGGVSEFHHRVWVGVPSTGSNLLPLFFPLSDRDKEDGFTDDSDPEAVTTAFDGNFSRVDKSWQKVDVESASLGTGGRQIEVRFRVDGGAWQTTLVDTVTSDNTLDQAGPSHTLNFPAATTGKKLELRFIFSQTSVTTTSPELLNFRVTGQLRAEDVDVIPLRLYLADGQDTLNGRESRVKAKLAQLRTWADQAAHVTLVDAEGTSRTCVFLPGGFRVDEVAREVGRRSEWEVGAVLAEVG